jgi:transposase
MAKTLVDDRLWALIEPLIPVKPRRTRNPGRKPTPDRACLTGILFVLTTGIQWEMLPQEMGCGCGMTCWRRLRDWQQAGVWQKLHETLLAHLNAADLIDWSRAVVDSASLRAVGGANIPARTPLTAENPARNTMSLRRRAAFLWSQRSRRRTSTTARSCCN